MPDIIYNNKTAHFCYHCHKKIKRGEGYKVWHYTDRNLYRHLGDCKTLENK